MKAKKLFSVLLACVLTVSLCACSSSSSTKSEDKSSDSSSSTKTAEVKKGTSKSGDITYTVDMTKYESGKAVKCWLPLPQSSDYQTIGEIKFDAASAKTAKINEKDGNKMLYIEWEASAEPSTRKATCTFHVSRSEILSPELTESGSVPSDMSEYLGSSSTIPVNDSQIKSKAEEITKGKTTVLDKARAIYDWIIENMNRDESVTGCGTGDVCTLLNTKGGKCTDINSVFVGLCRAAGVPARETFGIRINDADITKGQHCWAQFYLPGTGWVFADPADVLKAVLKNNWSKDSAETKAKAEYYWGNTDNERISLSVGRDVTLSPAQSGDKLNNFGYPYAEVDGTAVDYYKPTDIVYAIALAADK